MSLSYFLHIIIIITVIIMIFVSTCAHIRTFVARFVACCNAKHSKTMYSIKKRCQRCHLSRQYFHYRYATSSHSLSRFFLLYFFFFFFWSFLPFSIHRYSCFVSIHCCWYHHTIVIVATALLLLVVVSLCAAVFVCYRCLVFIQSLHSI